MRRNGCGFAGRIAVTVWALAALAQGAEEATTLTSSLASVTVYADRARVTRVAPVTLGPELQQFAFRKLPGWIDEGSVRVSVTPPGAAELLDVQVQQTYLARPDDEEVRKAEAAVREIADQVADLADERNALDAQARQLDSIRAFSLEKQPKDAAVREVKISEYGDMIKFVGQSMSDIARARRDLERRERDLQPELNARQRRLDELRQRAQLEQRTVAVTLRRAAQEAQATLHLTYMLPGATWQPVHELRCGSAADKVTLASFGTVTQTTGEDWSGVELSLSTQRSVDTIKIPELDKLLVGPGRVARAGGDSFSIANGKFLGQINLWNNYANPEAFQDEFAGNLKEQTAAQGANVIRFERIQQQRGTTAHFAAAGVQTVRTDGRPVRVPIGSVELPAHPKLLAAPAVSLNAVRTADVQNSGKQPLLPAEVLLYVDGAFLGKTEIDFVAPGESFPVFVGVADPIKLTRELDRKRSSVTWTGKRGRMQVCFTLSAENFGADPVLLQLADRLPVSETEDVRVLGVEVDPEAKPDAKGLLRWDVPLAPGKKREFRVQYVIEYPKDLPQAAVKGSPAATRVVEEIQHLEEALR